MTSTGLRFIAIAIAGGMLLVVLELVRRKRLMERYALLWLLASVVLLVLAVWNGLLTTLALAVGIHYPPSALFAVAAGFELLLLLHFSLSVSRLSDQNKVLAQRLGLLQRRLDEQEQRLDEIAGEPDKQARTEPRRELSRAR
jgi:hypothetical protein